MVGEFCVRCEVRTILVLSDDNFRRSARLWDGANPVSSTPFAWRVRETGADAWMDEKKNGEEQRRTEQRGNVDLSKFPRRQARCFANVRINYRKGGTSKKRAFLA